MLPILTALFGGADMSVAEVRKCVADAGKLTPEALHELVPSGKMTRFANRVSWALVHLRKAGLVEKVQHGIYRLAVDGKQLLAQSPPPRVNMQFLLKYPAYVAWRDDATDTADDAADTADTPEETLEHAAEQLRKALEADLLDRVRDAPPAFLERVVVDLLLAMGYGGGKRKQGWVTGQPGDGGIDGTIREDALGLDEVYLQAKKYAGTTVGEGDLRNFAGAIDAANTTKGVFVTTAGFTKSAKDYVAKSPKRIVLIDGEELARLMVVHEIGVRTRIRYAVNQIDEDYFDGEDL
jgi:restriction system protein